MERAQFVPKKRATWSSRLYISLRIRLGHLLFPQPTSNVLPSYGDSVVRIGPSSIIKRGHISEVETMEFLCHNTSLPIPRVRSVWTDRHDPKDRCWFIMEYIVGETWETSWQSMSIREKEEATAQMKAYVEELRRLRQADVYVGATGGRPCHDLRISMSDRFGPFPDIDSFYHYLLRKVQMIAGKAKATTLFQRLISLKDPQRPSIVFSHSDLAPRNIIINNGQITGIIDWGQSGWLPYWWEYVKAFYSVRLHADLEEGWKQFVETVLEITKEEEEIDMEIRDIEGFPD